MATASRRAVKAAGSLLAWDLGAPVLGLVGLSFFAAAFFRGRSAITAHFIRSVGRGAPTAVCWIGRIGHAARAVVFLVISWSLIRSAWFGNSGEAKGLGTALTSLGENRPLYALVVLGLVLFGLFGLIVARFRIIPPVGKSDLTLQLG